METNTTTRDRLERVAVALTATDQSPSPELHSAGLRLLARELDDIDRATRQMEAAEADEFRAYVAATPSSRPVSTICEESAARVRRIMGRA